MTRFGPLTLYSLLACGIPTLAADPPVSDADRLKALEKQVADLTKEVGELRVKLKLAPKPVLEDKLIGSWGMEKPPDAKFVGVVAVVLKADGSFQVITQNKNGETERTDWKARYTVVGKVVELKRHPITYDIILHVVSVDDKELVAKVKSESFPEHEIKLQRQ